jgi:hypothetical protein
VAPPIGTIPSGSGGGIPDEHFDKPILFRLLSISQRASKYEKVDVLAPTVDYIVLDPATGGFTEVRNVVVMQKNIRNELVTCYQRGDRAVAAVAVAIPGANDNPAKVLRALDDTNSGYGAAQARQYLADAAVNTFGWWAATA